MTKKKSAKKSLKKSASKPLSKKAAGKKQSRGTRAGKILTTSLYAYVEAGNAAHARKVGKSTKWGTFSAYINALIAKDRGVKPATGTKLQGGPKAELKEKSKKVVKKTASKKSSKKPSLKSSKPSTKGKATPKKKSVKSSSRKPRSVKIGSATAIVSPETSVSTETASAEQVAA